MKVIPLPFPQFLWGMLALAMFAQSAGAQWNPQNPVLAFSRADDGVNFTMKTGLLKIQVCSDRIVRVLYSPASSIPDQQQYVVIRQRWSRVPWSLESSMDTITLRLAAFSVVVTSSDGVIAFLDTAGRKLFADQSRTLTPVTVNGEHTYHAEMFSNLWGSFECFYGLGGHQSGVWNYRGEAVDISHDNTNIGIPFFISSNGYGIFWNNTSRSRFNNRFLNALYLSSEVADLIDYYFLYGPEPDTLVAGYRMLTGDAPLFGKWAYGYWQCKNRYMSQEEVLGIARRYRALRIPVDNIVQDWFWWNTMGEPVFDASRYPDPAGMIRDLHRLHFHFMISFWPYFRPGTKTYDQMDSKGFFIDRTKVAGFHPAGQALYDAFNPAARKFYWSLLDTALFRIGVDAWWLDTTEPETEGRETNILVTNRVATGNGARVANLYPLMTTTAVYEGQRHAADTKRVFILSRSAYAGSQRTAAAVWSGDVNADWVFLRRQIPWGLNCSLSGLPYWTTDIGGFLSGDPDNAAYRELFVRWFQFGTFNPLMRVHGTRKTNQNELWSYGLRAQSILTAFDRLRYRLLPYTYSLARMTTHERYTPVRPLVMDFRTDERAANIGDAFMFGPALLVNPVTEPAASTRRVYLPEGGWFDFWTGSKVHGGTTVDADAPLEKIPLFVRAGSIIPCGPDIQYSGESVADTLEIRIYTGASGSFTLYEDHGDSYEYELGKCATTEFRWDDATSTLSISARAGRFPGMSTSRLFHIVIVREGHGEGIELTKKSDQDLKYNGEPLVWRPAK